MKVLILQPAFLGDVILCSSLVESLRLAGHEVGIVVKKEAADLYEKDKRIVSLHVFDKREKDRGVRGLLKLVALLKQKSYDAAVIPHRSLRSALLVRLAGIPIRIGFATSAGSRFFTHKIAYKDRCHEIERNHGLLLPLGIAGKPPAPNIALSADDTRSAEKFFKKFKIHENASVIGIGPGSKWFTKQWGENRFKNLVGLIAGKQDVQSICFGGIDERPLCERICSADADKTCNAAGVLNLRESAAALKKVHVVVTNDNGLMHLAAASGARVVALFGPTVPEFGFSPWGDGHEILSKDLYCRPCSIHGSNSCPEKHFRCMTEIEPEEVFETVLKYIRSSQINDSPSVKDV